MATANRQWLSRTAVKRMGLDRAGPGLGHWRESLAFYQRNKSRWLKDERYARKFVAIRHRQIVDVDGDMETLAAKTAEAFSGSGLFCDAGGARGEPVYEVPSFVAVR